MSHTAELIAVGTEILLGNIANTDAQMLSEELAALGVNVLYHTVVGDNPTRLAEALELARRRVDIVITTGGLGPTYDDLTKQTICTVFGRKNVFHPEIADALRTHFASIGRELTENNLQQAYLPENCTIFRNHSGTAPGCGFCEGGVHAVSYTHLSTAAASSSRGRATTTLPSRSTAPTSAAARCACAWRTVSYTHLPSSIRISS